VQCPLQRQAASACPSSAARGLKFSIITFEIKARPASSIRVIALKNALLVIFKSCFLRIVCLFSGEFSFQKMGNETYIYNRFRPSENRLKEDKKQTESLFKTWRVQYFLNAE